MVSNADGLQKLGQGRSAEVFLDYDASGRKVARKIFGGDRASKLVLYLLTGAGNPYAWCRSAIRAAFARRRILSRLVEVWFGDKLRLPRTTDWRFNRSHRAFEIQAEVIDGSHAPLRGPGQEGPDWVRDLVDNVMRPLQNHLQAAGFDGLLWQAGRGNPVAASNFMLEREAPADASRRSWVWIDLESGVPALFALNPLATLGFYLPKSLHHRRWLFDDVDVLKLRRYIGKHELDIRRTLGPAGLDEIFIEIDELEHFQTRWRSIPRLHRSIESDLVRGRISAEEAEHYRSHPLRWYARLGARAVRRCAALPAKLLRRARTWLQGLDLPRLAARAWRFVTSQRYRERLARHLVAVRIRSWARRGFLDRAEVARLHRQLRRDDASSYLTDFVVHLMIKPPIKVMQWLVVPTALALGWLNVATAAFLVVAGGFIGRTLYTTYRLLQATARGQRRPWVALGVGLLPVVGNTAFPAQLLASSTEANGELARFILYDALAASGRAVPIWGGADSLTEHYCNRLGDVAVRWLRAVGPRSQIVAPEPQLAELAEARFEDPAVSSRQIPRAKVA